MLKIMSFIGNPHAAGVDNRRSALTCAAVGAVVLLVSLLSPGGVAAQNCLTILQQTDPAISWANCITSQMPPPAVPQQTILLGVLQFSPDGATAHMIWNPADGADNIYACPRGGGGLVSANPPMCLSGTDSFKSFDMQYQIMIAKPANYDLQVALTNPIAGGGSEKIPATIQVIQDGLFKGAAMATISFHPHILSEQMLTFFHSGAEMNNCLFWRDTSGNLTGPALPCSFAFEPSMQPQLGAFVAHYLPVAVIYQPPGSKSYAGFTTNTSYGTTLCWGTSTTSGTVEVKDASAFFGTQNSDSVETGIAQLASAVGGVAGETPVGAAAKIIGGVLSTLDSAFHIQTTTTTSQTQGQTVCKGASMNMIQGYDTDPARGNEYIMLQEALFVYVVVLKDPVSGLIALSNGVPTVILTLVSSTPNAAYMDDLQNPNNHYPAGLVEQIRALDVQLNPRLLTEAVSRTQAAGLDTVRTSFDNFKFRPRRLKAITGWDPLCYATKDNQVGLGLDNYTSSDVSTATVTTTTTNVSGFVASLFGQAGITTQSFTISSDQTNWQKYGTESLLHLECPEINPPYATWEMSYYLDTLFGTLLAVPGQKCISNDGCTPAGALITTAGTVNQGGAPVSNRMVVLEAAGKTYRTFTNGNGAFVFRMPILSNGSGTIIVGSEAFPVAYNGASVSNLNLRLPSGPTTTGTGRLTNTGPSSGKTPGKVETTVAAPTPCCEITALSLGAAVVTAKVKASNRLFNFAVKNSGLLQSLKPGQDVFANFRSGQVSIDGKDVCCQIIASTTVTPRAMPSAIAPAPTPPNQSRVVQARSSGPCCQITVINQQTGIVTAKVNATNQLFEFKVTNRTLLQSLKVGQPIYADFANKEVSLDGKTICCTVL